MFFPNDLYRLFRNYRSSDSVGSESRFAAVTALDKMIIFCIPLDLLVTETEQHISFFIR